VILQKAIIRRHGEDSELARAVGDDLKGKASALAYSAGVVLAFVEHWISIALYVAVAIMWFVPDPRIAKRLSNHQH
jgi:TMEM175 potassium channel family protein